MIHSEEIAGTPQQCFAATVDYESYPSWQSVVKAVTVRSRDDAGRGREVEFTIDLRVATVRYALLYEYDEPGLITWTYLDGDAKDVHGSYTFVETGRPGTTEARYDLTVELPVSIPSIVRSRIEREAMRRTVRELKRRVEQQ
jgi:ribosome-associated toxin RatA of RatAB toxin-antitoxin module